MSTLAYYLSAIALGITLVALHTLKSTNSTTTYTRTPQDQACAITHRHNREILVCTEVYHAR